MGTTRVDAAALSGAASQFAAAADILETAGHRTALRFNGSTAGRVHGADGERLHAALSQLCTGVLEWGRAAEEVGAALRAGAQYYSEAETRAAAVLG